MNIVVFPRCLLPPVGFPYRPTLSADGIWPSITDVEWMVCQLMVFVDQVLSGSIVVLAQMIGPLLGRYWLAL